MSSSLVTSINQSGLDRVMKLMGAGGAEACDLEKMGETCAFLCSDGAGVLNGTEIIADNGWSSY